MSANLLSHCDREQAKSADCCASNRYAVFLELVICFAVEWMCLYGV